MIKAGFRDIDEKLFTVMPIWPSMLSHETIVTPVANRLKALRSIFVLSELGVNSVNISMPPSAIMLLLFLMQQCIIQTM